MKYILYSLSFLLLLTTSSCHKKKKSFKGDEVVKAADFVEIFPAQQNNFFAADTNMIDLEDSTLIGYKVVTQFIPDSVFDNIYGDDKEDIEIYPVTKIAKKNEVYLILNMHLKKEITMAVALFDKKNNFVAFKQLIKNFDNEKYAVSVTANNEPTFTINKEKTKANKETRYSKSGWAYVSGSNSFTEVVHESNENPQQEIINPIDTLPIKQRYSGHYAADKRNFISVRDGKNAQEYLFFLHTEKEDGNCIGELKETMKIVDATHAKFTKLGEPCEINFSFEDGIIIIKENGNCGNRRGMNCSFNEEFNKVKIKSRKKK